jgi:hypothetical protein
VTSPVNVVGEFSGGTISSDGGALLLRETEFAAAALARENRGPFFRASTPAMATDPAADTSVGGVRT